MKRLLPLMIGIVYTLGAFAVIAAQQAETTAEPTAETNAVPEPEREIQGENAVLELFSDRIRQGRVGLLRISATDAEITGAEFTFARETTRFFYLDAPSAWYALLAIDIDQARRTHELAVTVRYADDTQETLTAEVDVINGNFIQQDVVLTEDKLGLIDPEIEAAELEQIFQVAAAHTPRQLWDSRGFQLPIDAQLTSPFGAVRVFNGTLVTRHTGWDFQAGIGLPLLASASGRVAFAGKLPIRGNYVLIDHGHGVYSGYAHNSIVHVTRGQSVAAGQVIGQVGSTGRSSSAHAHLEFIVNGHWVDAADFIRMYLPA